MKALSGPFGGIRFIPTGGVSEKNLAEYLAAPFIHAVGGSWLCTKADIAAHRFNRITDLCREARRLALGFELDHVGINQADESEARALGQSLSAAFQLPLEDSDNHILAGSGVEIMKEPFLGSKGHLALRTNSIPRAAAELAKSGFRLEESTARYQGGRIKTVYLQQEFGGFAIHLLQK